MHKSSLLAVPLLVLSASTVPGTGVGSAHTVPLVRSDIVTLSPEMIAANAERLRIAATLAKINPDEIAPGGAAAAFVASEEPEMRERSLECLTDAVYYEARSESEDGQRAVAQVVLNRVRHPTYPASVCGVVYQGSTRRTGCQFSFTCDGSLNRPIDRRSWATAREIAEQALNGYVYAPVGMATHYHTTAINPWWASSLRKAITIGAHVFYRWKGEWGNAMAFRQGYSGLEDGPAGGIEDVAEAVEDGRTIENGVTVYRGGGTIGSVIQRWEQGEPVTIHRGGAGEAASAADGVQVHSGSGVRIHAGSGEG